LISTWLLRQLVTIFGLKPLLILDFRPIATSDDLALAFLGVVVLPFSSVLFGDFLYYWFHRLQHAVPLLWRFHTVHHAIEELNVLNANHHFTEDIFKIPFISVPLALVQFQQGPHVTTMNIVIATLYAVVLTLVHANSRISYGPLNYVITRPLYHRIHHSIDALHHNKNFCGLFPIWDMLFGTAHFPARDERIKTGLSDKFEAKTIGQFLFALPPPRESIAVAKHEYPSEVISIDELTVRLPRCTDRAEQKRTGAPTIG
jgi:sterol desaturase/sphingolipid hydroxylase (fatty acid hydroxylase superfamily)